MANLNRIVLVGKLTSDPEAKFTVDGTPMTKFTLAINRYQREGLPAAADFIDIVSWSKLAEICGKHLKKGQLVLVDGRIQIRSFNDETGQKKWATEVVARNMQMLEKGDNSQASQPAAVTDQNINEEEVPLPEDDLPF